MMACLVFSSLCLALQTLHNLDPASTAHGKSGQLLPGPRSCRLVLTSISYSSLLPCPPHPLCLIKFYPSFKPSCSFIYSLPFRTS